MHRGESFQETYPVISGDVTSIDSFRDDLPFSAPDGIIHCASSSRGGPETYRSVFVEGIRNLQGAFPDVPVIFTSSTSVYGQTDGSVVDEPRKPFPTARRDGFSSRPRPSRGTGEVSPCASPGSTVRAVPCT